MSFTHKIATLLLPQASYSVLVACGAVCVLWIWYNCFLHPLSSVPGPFLARLSRLWLLSVDLSGYGSKNLRDLHHKYGPIIRVAPNEVSVYPLDAYNDLYGQKSKFLKDSEFYDSILPREVVNIFTTADPALHASLRRLFSYAFSRTNLLDFQAAINDHVGVAIEHARRHISLNRPLPLYFLSTSYTTDIIAKLSYGENVGALERENLDHPFPKVMVQLTKSSKSWATTHYSFLRHLYKLFHVADLGDMIQMVTKSVMKTEAMGDDAPITSLVHDASKRAKAADYDLPLSRKVTVIVQIVGAGVETTAMSICGTLQHVLRNPEIHRRLYDELKNEFPNKNSDILIQHLEKLRYFQACIKEGIRVTCAIPTRMPRIVPDGGYNYEQYYIPSGVKISSANLFRCYDEDIFPNPTSFVPERWLSGDLSRLNSSWLPFSKGKANCIGQHMAIMEIELFVARFIRSFEVVEFIDDFDVYERVIMESCNGMRMRLRETRE